MNITTFFSDNGVPATGLTPKIDVWELDGSHPVNDQDMVEIVGSGAYYYVFAGYDISKNYVIRADGGATLTGYDRYQFASNETPTNVAEISKEGSSLDDLHKLQGLDLLNSMTVTPTSREVGTIKQVISGCGEKTSTVTRTA